MKKQAIESIAWFLYPEHPVIDGFDGVCFDFNYAYRDYPALIKAYGYNGFSPSLSVTDDIK